MKIEIGRMSASPDEVAEGIIQAAEERTVLESTNPPLYVLHPDQWVGVSGGEVIATSGTYDQIFTKIEEKGSDLKTTKVSHLPTTEKRSQIL